MGGERGEVGVLGRRAGLPRRRLGLVAGHGGGRRVQPLPLQSNFYVRRFQTRRGRFLNIFW